MIFVCVLKMLQGLTKRRAGGDEDYWSRSDERLAVKNSGCRGRGSS